jgi:hypothetical protein
MRPHSLCHSPSFLILSGTRSVPVEGRMAALQP